MVLMVAPPGGLGGIFSVPQRFSVNGGKKTPNSMARIR